MTPKRCPITAVSVRNNIRAQSNMAITIFTPSSLKLSKIATPEIIKTRLVVGELGCKRRGGSLRKVINHVEVLIGVLENRSSSVNKPIETTTRLASNVKRHCRIVIAYNPMPQPKNPIAVL
ncbi:hypothetical protein [Cellvibrio sp. KY-GH-1]|uniref:hypothetical protein n=1 Tax=Cellvibrio sp. KY-GH-1 TaxID=2303332 RepID=UPI0017829041|nr:hypothetical protein [Cellvibrio sp. KY-GH-1]